jgi:hypothetical protein
MLVMLVMLVRGGQEAAFEQSAQTRARAIVGRWTRSRRRKERARLLS